MFLFQKSYLIWLEVNQINNSLPLLVDLLVVPVEVDCWVVDALTVVGFVEVEVKVVDDNIVVEDGDWVGAVDVSVVGIVVAWVDGGCDGVRVIGVVELVVVEDVAVVTAILINIL